MASVRYLFRDFRLDPAARELWQGETLVVLPGSAFDCLHHLIEHRDRAVGRDELIAAVWGRVDVADGLLAQTVLRVRRTLGDSGSDGAIRTVARFGYRWVEPIAIEGVDDEPPTTALVAPIAPAPPPVAGTADAGGSAAAVPASRTRTPRAAVAAAMLLLALGLAWWWTRPAPVIALAAEPVAAGTTPALVFPASVAAAPGWEWLRLGLMDLIGNRLREGGVATAPGDAVLALMADRSTEALLALPAVRSALRISPDVRFDNDRWRVRLRLERDGHAPREIDAESADVLHAARSAADLLLVSLGRTPPAGGADPPPVALEALLQRTRAAILSDQLDLAGHLIDQAPPALRALPAVELRRAQIEQARGRYAPAAQQLQALLDRVDASLQPALRGRILLALGTSQFQGGALDAARATFDDAITTLAGVQEPITLGAAYGSRAAIASRQEDYAAAAADLGRARVEMEAGGDALGLAQIDISLGLTHVRNNRPALGLPLLREADARLAALGAREETTYARLVRVGAELQLLDYAEARATVAAVWPPEAHTANLRLRWRLVLARVHLLLAVGELGEADALLARIERDASPDDDADVVTAARALAAIAQAERGRHAAAAAQAAAAMTPALARDQPDLYLSAWCWRLRSLRGDGQVALAREESAALQAWVAAHDNPWRRIHAALAGAEQTAAEGDATAALAQFADAYAQAAHLGIPDDMVTVAGPYVRALLDAGQRDTAATVVGSVAGWADEDARAAWAQALLYRAQGRVDAWDRSAMQALALARERVLPPVRVD